MVTQAQAETDDSIGIITLGSGKLLKTDNLETDGNSQGLCESSRQERIPAKNHLQRSLEAEQGGRRRSESPLLQHRA